MCHVVSCYFSMFIGQMFSLEVVILGFLPFPPFFFFFLFKKETGHLFILEGITILQIIVFINILDLCFVLSNKYSQSIIVIFIHAFHCIL